MKPLFYIPLFFIAVFVSFKTLNNTTISNYYESDYRQQIIANITALKTETALLKKIALGFEKDGNLKALQNQVAKTRLAYKKNEMVIEYYYPKHCKAYLNGAPLMHADPFPVDEKYNDQNYYGITPQEYSKDLPLDYLDIEHYKGERRVIEPEGLQTIDELVFSGEIPSDKLIALCTRLDDALPAIQIALEKRNFFYDFEIVEAARMELVRILSMGVTGFDTPGSLNAMPEAAEALQSIAVTLQPLLSQAGNQTKQNIEQQFAKAVAYVNKNNNFDRFDRLAFITDHINPLYKMLGALQQELHLPSSAERWGKVPAWNAKSTNIFDEDFLNPYFYTMLPEDKDSKELRELGKKLFYEPLLSSSGTMSCATCHKPELAFTDGLATSASSVKGKNVLRNAPTLINAVFSDRYFYDLRAYDLEEQAEHVVENHMEFNTSFETIVNQLNADTDYSKAFEAVFGKGQKVTRYNFAQALSSYVLSLRGFDSDFDKYIRGESASISKEVKDGFNLFAGKAACATCHYIPLFNGLVPPLFEENETEVLGVLNSATNGMPDDDAGRYANGVTDDKLDIYRRSFKTTTVRNAALTAPYFHNGAYKTLEEVIDFYDKGGAAGMGFDYEVYNQTLAPDALNLTKKEKKALIAFIASLNSNIAVYK
ncbi:cytochrome-c peroxidase [Flavobacterium akiainvivens]|uniref:cytochrome-c peroxidase n=1 Tax=Flavobacterium akiainvivens TaxID=1202724 RepID=UPI0006C85C58|nr:cytochrome c peroxidase [Flavobacterium akiainvivens]SFQ42584.1 cytochrome c peroxidase [Flavobacterium akiainvivens]